MITLDHQLLEERLAKQRQYVLANTRARWGFVGFGIVLLAAVKLAGITPVSSWFILAFAASFAAANAGVRRLVQRGAFQPWYAQLNLVVGCLLISAVLYAMGPNGHVLYGAFLIAPLQAALYLERREAWGALIINLVAFTLVTALAQVTGHGWPWALYIQEGLVLVFVCVALVPMLVQIVDRLRSARGVLGEIERGDLTRQMDSSATDVATDELGYLSVSVNRTTAAIAEIIREIGRQGQALATMAGELAGASRELQAASQSISTTTDQLSQGTERQRQLIGYGRQDSEAASGLATTLHARAQEAERQITEIALQAHRRGEEVAKASTLLMNLMVHMDHASEVAAVLDKESREIGKARVPCRRRRGQKARGAKLTLRRRSAGEGARHPGPDQPGRGRHAEGPGGGERRRQRRDDRARRTRCDLRRPELHRPVRHDVRRGDRESDEADARSVATDGRGRRYRGRRRHGRAPDVCGDGAAARLTRRADQHVAASVRCRRHAGADDPALPGQRRRFEVSSRLA